MGDAKDYSTKKMSKKLLQEIEEALSNIRGWGSVEIYVQDYKVVQIIERNIKKTSSGSKLNVLKLPVNLSRKITQKDYH